MLRLNLSTDYALRTLLLLAARPEQQISVREVAAFYEISPDHVSKVVQHLTLAGWVKTGRGRSGGLRLAQPAVEITVGAVVRHFEGPVALLDCVTAEGVCTIQPGCRLKRLLQRVGQQLMAELDAVTLAELASPTPTALAQRLIPLSAVAPSAMASPRGSAPAQDAGPDSASPSETSAMESPTTS